MRIGAVVSRAISRVEEAMLKWGIVLIALLTVINVLSRTFAGISLAFAEELSQFLIVAVTFFGLSYAASRGRHIRMTAIYDQLSRPVRRWLMVFIAGSTALLLFALAVHAVRYIGTVHTLGTVSPALQVPLYLVYLTVPAGLMLAGIQYSLTVLKNLRSDEVWLSYTQKDEYDSGEVSGI